MTKKFHSEHKGRTIYFDASKKRRPWSIYKPTAQHYAEFKTLDAARHHIEQTGLYLDGLKIKDGDK